MLTAAPVLELLRAFVLLHDSVSSARGSMIERDALTLQHALYRRALSDTPCLRRPCRANVRHRQTDARTPAIQDEQERIDYRIAVR